MGLVWNYEEQAVTDPLGPETSSFRVGGVVVGAATRGARVFRAVAATSPPTATHRIGFRISRTQSIP